MISINSFQPNKKQNYKCNFKPQKLMLVTESVSKPFSKSSYPQSTLCPIFSGSGIIAMTSSMAYNLASVTHFVQ